jgi:hypothetical protein
MRSSGLTTSTLHVLTNELTFAGVGANLFDCDESGSQGSRWNPPIILPPNEILAKRTAKLHLRVMNVIAKTSTSARRTAVSSRSTFLLTQFNK